jgi:predicted RecA/RadA family phage recombinase
MATNYQQPGEVIDYVNGTGAAITSDAVVKIGTVLGVALGEIAASETGSVQITGVFTVPKVSAAVIAQGESLTWDVSAGAFDDSAATPATGDVTGAAAVAFEAAGAGVTTLAVRFTGVPGTVA